MHGISINYIIKYFIEFMLIFVIELITEFINVPKPQTSMEQTTGIDEVTFSKLQIG